MIIDDLKRPSQDKFGYNAHFSELIGDNQPENRVLFVGGIVCRRGFETPENVHEFISIEGKASHSLGRAA